MPGFTGYMHVLYVQLFAASLFSMHHDSFLKTYFTVQLLNSSLMVWLRKDDIIKSSPQSCVSSSSSWREPRLWANSWARVMTVSLKSLSTA